METTLEQLPTDGLTARERFEGSFKQHLKSLLGEQEIICSTLRPHPIALTKIVLPHGTELFEVITCEDGLLLQFPAHVIEEDKEKSGVTVLRYTDLADNTLLLALTERKYTIPSTGEERTVLTLQVMDSFDDK